MWLQQIKRFFGLLPDLNWIKNKSVTPDIARLDLKEKHLLFVVDDLKKGFKHHGALNNAKLVDKCYTQRAFTFEVFKDSLYVPIPRELKSYHGVGAKPRKILGEVYLVDTDTLTKLDSIKLNGVLFNRRRVALVSPYRKKYKYKPVDNFPLPPALDGEKISREYVRIVHAYMYVGVKKHWEEFPLSDFTPVPDFPYENPHNPRKWLKENFYKLPKPK